MNPDLQFFAAALVGLMGGVHCFGMCGGVVGAFSQALPREKAWTLQQRFGFLLSYNSGRIFSYVMAGIAVGGLSGALASRSTMAPVMSGLQLLAGLMLILMGLYISQWSGLLAKIEQAGQPVWQALAPLRQRLLPIATKPKAFAAGLLWGWIPCGLVYSTLTWALASGDPVDGGLIMLGFGLGTLPALLVMGAAAEKLAIVLRNERTKLLSSLVLIVYGGQMAYIALTQML